jgi:hypothetical protein
MTQPNGDTMVQIPPNLISKITQFELDTRPFTWASFNYIHNEPTLAKGEISPEGDIPLPGPLPQFTRTLPNGASVDVVAVLRGRSEGERWWRPDGTLLTGRIKPWEWASYDISHPSGDRPRLVLIRYKPSATDDDPAYCVQPTTDVNSVPQTDSYFATGHADPQSPIIAQLVAEPDAQKINIRLGVANGKWKSIASIRVDFNPNSIKQTGTASNEQMYNAYIDYSSKSGWVWIDNTGAKHVQLFLPDTEGINANQAQRVVATMNDGSRVVLSDDGSMFQAGVGVIKDTYFMVNPTPGIEPPQADLAKVKRFDLEVQPYTWVTFPAVPVEPKE